MLGYAGGFWPSADDYAIVKELYGCGIAIGMGGRLGQIKVWRKYG